jgi:hypothetical protein
MSLAKLPSMRLWPKLGHLDMSLQEKMAITVIYVISAKITEG